MLIFTLVPLGAVWAKYHVILLKNRNIILSVVGISILYQVIVDIFVQRWGAWFFSSDKILGLFLFSSPIEDTIFIVLISAVISSSVIAFVYHKEKNGQKSHKK